MMRLRESEEDEPAGDYGENEQGYRDVLPVTFCCVVDSGSDDARIRSQQQDDDSQRRQTDWRDAGEDRAEGGRGESKEVPTRVAPLRRERGSEGRIACPQIVEENPRRFQDEADH